MADLASIDRTAVGFKYLRERGGELHSPFGQWPARGVVDAACESRQPDRVPHMAPAPDCTCGSYAVSSLDALLRSRPGLWLWRLLGSGSEVTAAVQLWSSRGRPVMVGVLRDGPGYQFRAPHMRVLALADSPAARRVGRRHGLPVVPLAGLEPYAREHGRQLQPERSEQPLAPAATVQGRSWVGSSLVEAAGRRVRPRAPRAWAVGLAAALTLVAAVHLAAVVMVHTLLVAASVLGWLAPRAARWLLWAILNPFQAVWIAVVAVVLLVVLAVVLITAWVWTADLVGPLLPR